MTDMIERVARALASQFGDADVVMGEALMGEYYRNAAITAIKAMRELSDDDVRRILENISEDWTGFGAGDIRFLIEAMTDPALEGTEQ